MSTLFSPSDLKLKRRAPDRDQRRRRIATGAPRLVESSPDRAARADTAAWEALLTAIKQSSQARLALLKGRGEADQTACPWARVVACDRSCRCGGSGMVTVGFLLEHYTRLVGEILRTVGRLS
jgi:hypothetical protein